MVASTAPQSEEVPASPVRKAIIRKVLDDLLTSESGNMALQHLGLLWMLYEFSDEDEPITTAWVNEQTNVSSTTIIKFAERLENLGLLKRKRITARHGKGRAWQYSPKLPDDLQQQAVSELMASARPFGTSISLADLLAVSQMVNQPVARRQ
jgi:predicted transcriptional regulator